MNDGTPAPSGPDLSSGLDLAKLADGDMVLGHVGPEAVLWRRSAGPSRACAPNSSSSKDLSLKSARGTWKQHYEPEER
jgi:hypothetical protein